MIPDEQQALSLHKKYGSNERTVRHCQAVARISKALADAAIANGQRVSESAIVAGALLHDIGRSQTQLVSHGYVGAQLLEREGIDNVVVEIVRRHVGAGISEEEAKTLGFPEGNYIPSTLEEKIVCFSDKMLDGEKVRPLQAEIDRFVKKGHDVERLRRLRVDLATALKEDPERIVLRGSR